MRKMFLFSTLVAFGMVFSANAQNSDVSVDLSVLNGLGGDYQTAEQPLFPVVKKAPKPIVIKAKKIETAPLPEVEVKKPVVVASELPEVEVKKPVVAASEPVVADEIANAPIADPEPEVNAVEKVSIPEKPAAPTADVPLVKENKETETVAESLFAPQTEVKPVTESQPIADFVKPVVDNTKPESVALSVPDSKEVGVSSDKVNNKIVFYGDTVILTDGDKQTVDVVVSTFENPQSNKIGIFAYNYDDGVDSFKKKRLSLNRAIEIRSYLLSKGFKNFSIKVINVNDDKSKENLVEIEEVK